MVKVQKNVRTPFPTFYSRPLHIPENDDNKTYCPLFDLQSGTNLNLIKLFTKVSIAIPCGSFLVAV